MGKRLWALALALALAGVAGAACGGSDPAPPPAPPPDTGSPPIAPGSSPTPPSAPAGPSTPTPPSGSSPSDPPTPPAAGTPPTAGAPPPDAPAPPGGTSPAACAGLLPDAPGPGVQYTRDVGTALERQASCGSPITDGHGEWIGVGLGQRVLEYDFVSASSPAAAAGSLVFPVSLYGGPVIAPQPDGYHAAKTMELPGTFQRYDAKGAFLSDDHRGEVWAIEGVPGGGSVLVTVQGLFGLGAGNPVYRLVWMSAAGERRAEAPMPGADPLIALSSTGNVLAFVAGRARWYARDGSPLTDWFSFGGDARAFWRPAEVLEGAIALADGSVVVGLGGEHPLRFEAGAPRAAPPPGWVTSRSGAAVAAVRGARANAFATVKQRGADGCTVEIELLTPTGESCGTTRLEAPSPCERVTFGADRTVFTTGQGSTGPTRGVCSWHWWSGLLR